MFEIEGKLADYTCDVVVKCATRFTRTRHRLAHCELTVSGDPTVGAVHDFGLTPVDPAQAVTPVGEAWKYALVSDAGDAGGFVVLQVIGCSAYPPSAALAKAGDAAVATEDAALRAKTLGEATTRVNFTNLATTAPFTVGAATEQAVHKDEAAPATTATGATRSAGMAPPASTDSVLTEPTTMHSAGQQHSDI